MNGEFLIQILATAIIIALLALIAFAGWHEYKDDYDAEYCQEMRDAGINEDDLKSYMEDMGRDYYPPRED